MNIFPIEDKKAYENLALKHGAVFNSLDWLALYEDKLFLYGIYDRGKNLIGAFHLFEYKKMGFKFIINPPVTPNIGLFYLNQTSNKSSDSAYSKDIINSLTNFLSNKSYSLLSISLPNNIVDTQPFQWNGYKVRPQYSYIIDLNASIDDIWQHFSSQRRKSVRRAMNDNLKVVKVEHYKDVQPLVEKTFLRQKKKLIIS